VPRSLTLTEVAELAGGRVEGDPERRVDAVRALASAGPGDLAFVTAERFRGAAEASVAGALLVPPSLADVDRDRVVCADPGLGIVAVLERLYPEPRPAAGVHSTAVVAATATVHPEASVGPLAVVGERTVLEARVAVHAGAVLGDDCRVGEGSTLHPRVVLYPRTVLGRDVIVHAGAVVGSDGFGYATGPSGPVKVPQVGCVIVEDRVEIGANTAIDRATLEATRIGADSKLDNLVQVGHNVELGPACIVCGQAGVAGSTRLGRGVVLGGQAGVADHLEIGDRVQIAAASAALQSLGADQVVAGIPAVEIRQWRRQTSGIARLGQMLRRLRALEKTLEAEEERHGDDP
jgi:UDP-3-O-[3-hydroxymyristoyl] glucosamine N-acyltransferase